MRDSIRWVLLVGSVLLLAVVAGLVAAVVVLAVTQAVLPPFRREDDDTLRDYGPAALAYLAWGAGSLVTFVLGWRRIRRYR